MITTQPPEDDNDRRSPASMRGTPASTRGNGEDAFQLEPTLDGDYRIIEILDAYFADLREGRAPDKAELLAKHPQLAEQLEACLAGLEFIQRATEQQGQTPRVLGDFKLLREVGRGGMGAVFEAEQVSLQRRVAVKVLRFGPVADSAAVERFRREAETVAHLHHTNIVPIFFVGSQHGVNYYAMEFIDGRSLAQVLEEHPGGVEPRRAVEWGLQAAEALSHAHLRGVIHRDIKPSNLLLDDEGRIWLTDFGLAKRLDDVTLSKTGALLGTPRYMSPEQAMASKHPVDHRTDIYSLGATLYELMTGRPVFQADSPHQVIHQILHQDPLPPRQLSPGVGRDIETILLKCLDKEAEQRYASASELAEDFRAVLEGRPIRARRANWTELSVKWVRRHQRSLAFGGTTVGSTLAILAVALLVWFSYQRGRIVPVTLVTSQPPLTAELQQRSGALVTRQTVPTVEAIEVAAGDYELRVVGDRRLSESYRLTLRRGQTPKFDLTLDQSLLAPPLAVDGAHQLVATDRGVLALLFDAQGLSCWDVSRQELKWKTDLSSTVDPMLAPQVGWVWPWNRLTGGYSRSGWGVFDQTPYVHTSAIELSGDGVPDFLIAMRHQACLLAVSGVEGRILWVAGRSDELERPISNMSERRIQGVRSGVVSQPTLIDDQNGDAIADVVCLLAQEDLETRQVQRWVELVCGQTGATLWRCELSDDWFIDPATPVVPEAYRWFTGSSTASAFIGGSQGFSFRQFYKRDAPYIERTGYFHQVPSRPALITANVQGQPSPWLLLVAGSKLLLIDPATGELAGHPVDCGFQPGLPPLIGDVDADGLHDIVLTERMPDPGGGMRPSGKSRVRVSVISTAAGQPLWSREFQAMWPSASWDSDPVAAPHWPQLIDIDGDQRWELLIPNGTSKADIRLDAAWGTLEALDAATGETRWQRRIKTMDQQTEHFLPGPDLDGDGKAEIFVATLWSADFDLYVDALSGATGESLWVGHHRLRRLEESARYRMGRPLWWEAGLDGWPQLVVPLVPDDGSDGQSQVCLFSAGTGQLTRLGKQLTNFVALDVNSDGVDDLLAYNAHDRTSLDRGGELICFRGTPREWWNGLGTPWEATVDLDNDGVRDLVHAGADGALRAVSGASGQALWETPLNARFQHEIQVAAAVSRPYGARLSQALAEEFLMAQTATLNGNAKQPAPGDFDRDGVCDLVVYSMHVGGDRPLSPLKAISGRDGRRLWSAELSMRFVAAVLSIDFRDLDGDGVSEVIWVGAGDLDYPTDRLFNAHQKQLHVAVLSGVDGKLLWHRPLSPQYGLTPQTSISPSELEQGHVAISYGDLNSDGVLDVLLPSLTTSPESTGQVELLALDGRAGQVLWTKPLPQPRNANWALTEIPPVVCVDLTGQGRLQVVLLSFEQGPETGKAVARLQALEATSGMEVWATEFETRDGSGLSLLDEAGLNNRPRPLLLRDHDRYRICVNLWESPERFVVVDSGGQVVSEVRLETMRGYHRGQFRVWACDANGDDQDELLYINRDQLMVASPATPDQPWWQFPVRHLWSHEIEGLLPADGDGKPTVILRDAENQAVCGLDALTGQVRWTAPSPMRAVPGYMNNGMAGLRLAMLSSPQPAQPARLFVQQRFCSRVYSAVSAPSTEDNSSAPPASGPAGRLAGAPRVPAVVASTVIPRRQQQPLPWAVPVSQSPAGLQAAAWACFYCLCLLYLPGRFLIHSCSRRQWSVGWMLLAPAAAAAPLLAVITDAPPLNSHDLLTKLTLSLATLPAILASVRVVSWCWRGRWKLVGWWLVVIVAVSWLLAKVQLRVRQTVEAPLEADEVYAWDGWWQIGLIGAYAAAWLLCFCLGVGFVARRVRRWWQTRKLPAPAA